MQGQGSKNFDKAKEFCFTNPDAAHQLLQKITDTTIAYLKEKVKAGVMLFKYLILGEACYLLSIIKNFLGNTFSKLLKPLKDDAPVIAFGKGCWFALRRNGKI